MSTTGTTILMSPNDFVTSRRARSLISDAFGATTVSPRWLQYSGVHRFDDDDDDFDPDRLAHYDALACGIVSVQRARLMS